MPLTATRIAADTATVTVASLTPAVADWSRRYFGPWWNAGTIDAPAPDRIADSGGLVLADTDPGRVDDIATLVRDYGHDETVYANARTLVARHDGITYAVQPDERIGYQANGRRLVIVGDEPEPVAVAAARLARELVRGQLLAEGWTVLHASAATQNGDAVLTLGDKGAGKTTSALLLARAGWGLLANDRVFVRPEPDGRVRVLPWPSAAALGLGLLDATGLYDQVREKVLAGGQLHPTQHPTVTQALMDGRREPLWKDTGKELKPQFFPDQLSTWLGLTLSISANVAGLLFPTMDPGATPAPVGSDRRLTEADIFDDKTEDRYPDIFGLTPTTTTGTEALTEHLARLPRRSLVLSHDTDASAALLAKTAEELTASH
ncbi:hypothetical protein [Streptomyces sp. MBT53]|uniref:hypothetical protein n=1 Tax=Streptomyces sp. MBT53 TaxID=1488384 RepID=UPI001912CDAA|nr:hypothetical protein [Streptomyces sp. MBT53]MBK6015805.1 hypothetical protein [Streptomyces sp. MBT53]